MPNDEKLKKENERLRAKLSLAENQLKSSPKERGYTIYLMQANALLEKEYSLQQEVIEAYQKHYARYTHFYAEYEKRMLQ
jgi:hypothetical protein